MSLAKLVWMEVIHRKLNFAIALTTILVAVGFAVWSLTSIRAYQLRTEQHVAALDDGIRKITKDMGFNINILPMDQNLADFHANDFAEKTMPFEFVQRLADSKLVSSLNHLRPALIRKMEWPEYSRQIVLMGVTGVIPWNHRSNPEKPLTEAVPDGTMIIGEVLAKQLQVQAGDTVKLNGVEFRIDRVFDDNGTKDAITVWIDLKVAQQMLNLPGRINLIQALECNCAAPDRLAQIQTEVSQVLGSDVQVIELSTTAIARARAREDVKAEGQRTMAQMQRRSTLLLIGLVLAGSVLIGLFALANVRERRNEIGLWRALGVSTGKIMGLFLSKAVFVGLCGAVGGFALGYLVACVYEARPDEKGVAVSAAALYDAWLLLAVVVFTPLLTTLATWLPALSAAGQDPAMILAQE